MPQTLPRLETDRLILRPPLREDLDAWAEFAADEEAQRFLGGVQPRGAVWRSLCVMRGAWDIEGFSMFSVIEKASGRWIGRLGPWRPDGWPGDEIGWSLTRSAWGRGYATEGAAAAIDWAFTHLGWREVIHCIDARNERSKAVARRLGSRFLRSAMLPPPFDQQTEIWGQSREEWQARCVSG
ncbi:MAG TPA: GNAT family N-acetyltransferase [Ferrovibrio sp.]|jgi:RimJ/RimL family protein N-acetyltransferase|uniref:GNAT family N-acetyltransferase n=1 Tax=Ferrovibrio sp. TaxID=1917215 RepID=UPI002B4B7685|nr:GNAT family N-acetyltransferase [Ferrovibrio sp.]HLT78542.1 GNAT family N-acetyltransferase [Ferrovibrio sp.]